jgi:hypothetical protein
MRLLTFLTLMLLTVPGTALAAPPANDNRADAEAIPAFPHTLTATTAEATVERLDPQVSRCGRVESTLWYRIDTAPDGLIALTVKGAAGVAPVLRIYRRGGSTIQEVDCASAGPGGGASASLETVRGSSYLVLVGRRPSTADGDFELRAELFLPPANDNRVGAQVIAKLPGTVRGTTLGATGDEADPGRCGLAGATVWYRLSSRRDGRILLRISAAGQLDAAIVVLERVRSQTRTVNCGTTNRRGQATVSFASRRGATYLIAVGHLRNADPGTFRIDALASEAAESRLAGKLLPRSGVRSSVHGLTDVNDVWRVSMRAGTTYRIGFRSTPCAAVTLSSRRHPTRPLARLGCADYETFTPGPDGTGAYVLEVIAGAEAVSQRYVLMVVPASSDDFGIGIELRNRVAAKGALDPPRFDLFDLYHFDVERRGDVRVDVTGGAALVLYRDDGSRLGEFSSIRRHLEPGRYVVAVAAALQDAARRYVVTLLIRQITTTSLRLPSPTVPPGSALTLRPEVANASGGAVEIQIDRFDPITGWHFNRLLRLPAGGSTTWAPPAEGRWRLRATYKGTIEASLSRSGYAHLLVERT